MTARSFATARTCSLLAGLLFLPTSLAAQPGPFPQANQAPQAPDPSASQPQSADEPGYEINDGTGEASDLSTQSLQQTRKTVQEPILEPDGAIEVQPTQQGRQAIMQQADPPGRIGRVATIEGDVAVMLANTHSWEVAGRNRPLISGDSVWVPAGARAELQLGATRVRLDSGSLLSLTHVEDSALQAGLKSGTAVIYLAQSPNNDLVEFDLPGASSTLLKAGTYKLQVSLDGYQRLIVRHGEAEVRVGTQASRVAVGQQIEITQAGIATAAVEAGPKDAFDSWGEERQRAMSSAPALKYVSEQMVGYEDLDANGHWASTPDYGTVWRPNVVPTGWSPFGQGHWIWLPPWGWTWVDDMPWGFAPSHYGRWVYYDSAWAWAPGPRHLSPFYLPHLVTFVGGASFGAGVGLGIGAVGWYPLGFGEAFYPGYGCSYRYTHAINAGQGSIVQTAVRRPPMMNRGVPNGVVAVRAGVMQHAQSVGSGRVKVPARAMAQARLGLPYPAIHPLPASYAQGRISSARIAQPPAHLMARQMPSDSFSGSNRVARQPLILGPGGRVSGGLGRPAFRQPEGFRQQMRPVAPMYRPVFAPRYDPPHVGYDVHPSVGHPAFTPHFGGESHFGGAGHFGGGGGHHR